MSLTGIIIGFVVFVFFLFLAYLISLFPFSLWLHCWSSGVSASPLQLIGMKLRRVATTEIIEEYIRARRANLDLTLEKLEVHALSGGNVNGVIDAIISANRAGLDLSFERAAAIDLAGRDVNGAVRMSVQPKVMRTPKVHGVSKDGIEIIVSAKVTVRANLSSMVGGSGEETIMARVGEGIVSAIGSAKSHKDILVRPECLTERVMSHGLDSGSAYEIVSLDIADIDVGRNIGAALKNSQAVADKRVAEARAEGRRAMAFAQTQENKAAEAEAAAKLIHAEMAVPKTLANTFRQGKLLVSRKPRRKKAEQTGSGFGDDS